MERCGACYRLRAEQTVRVALEKGIRRISSTIFSSPTQNVELARCIFEELARGAGLELVYFDGRAYYKQGMNEVSRMSIYRQPYCGCIFSEYERFKHTTKELWKGAK